MKIYLITNRVNGKKYVGLTNGKVEKRWTDHKRSASQGSTLPLHCAITKYGVDSFSIETIDEGSSRADLCRHEVEAIALHDCRAPSGYNLTEGGDGNHGLVLSEAQRYDQSLRSKAFWAGLSPEERAIMGAKISKAKKGRPVKRTAPSSLRGAKRTQAFKDSVSEGMKKYVAALPDGEMSRRALLGRDVPKNPVLSEEGRTRMSEGQKIRAAEAGREEMARRGRLGAAKRWGH